MRKRSMAKLLLIGSLGLVLLIPQSFAVSASDTDNSLQTERHEMLTIDDGIANLSYRKEEVLASNGDKIESFLSKEGLLKNNQFIVVERTKKSLTTTPVDISIIDSIMDRTYPGALQLADTDFVNNRPNVLQTKRKPLNISIDLPGLKNENTIQVANPTNASVRGAIDTLLGNWSDNHSANHTLPARIQYSEAMVHSESQLSSALNINSTGLKNALGLDFEAISKGDKKAMVAAYKQIFYTVSAETPNNPSDLFDESVTFNELTRKGVSNEKPPMMVSNVAFGRTIYVKLETTSKEKDVQAAFKALLSGNAIEVNGKYKDVLDESTFTAVVLGGDSKEHNKIVTTNFDEIKDVIVDNAEFSLKNPAYPMSYTSTFLKDNSIAAVHNHTEYIETQSTAYSSGKININHRGAYIAQFEITWDEISYDAEGNEVLKAKAWQDNWRDKTAPFTSTMYMPANATNIRIFARESTGLAWDWWRTVLDEYNVPLSKEINVSIGGTTLSPTGSIDYPKNN